MFFFFFFFRRRWPFAVWSSFLFSFILNSTYLGSPIRLTLPLVIPRITLTKKKKKKKKKKKTNRVFISRDNKKSAVNKLPVNKAPRSFNYLNLFYNLKVNLIWIAIPGEIFHVFHFSLPTILRSLNTVCVNWYPNVSRLFLQSFNRKNCEAAKTRRTSLSSEQVAFYNGTKKTKSLHITRVTTRASSPFFCSTLITKNKQNLTMTLPAQN